MLAGIVVLAAFLAAPPLRPDQPLAPPVIGLPSPSRGEGLGSVATDGHTYLAAWVGYHGRIYAGRFNAEGTLLDPMSIPIDDTEPDTDDIPVGLSLGWGTAVKPNVLFTGNCYVIVYTVGDSSLSSATGYLPEVRVRRVGTDGTLLDARPRVIATGATHAGAAFNGTFIGVLLSNGTLQRLDADGNLYGEAIPAFFPPYLYTSYTPLSLTACREAFIAVARNGNRLQIRKVGAGEQDISLPCGADDCYVQSAAIASNGTSSLLVVGAAFWYPPPQHPQSVVAMEIRSTGTTPETGRWKIIDDVSQWDTYPNVVADGTGYVTAWTQTKNQLLAQRLSSDGTPVASPSPLASGPAQLSDTIIRVWDLINAAGRFIAITPVDLNVYTTGHLHAVTFGASGADSFTPGPSFTFARTARPQYGAAIRTNGVTSLVAWYEAAEDNYLLRAALIDGRGTVGPPIELSTAALTASAPAIASNGTDFLVVWSEGYGDVRARRIAPSGQFLDPSPIPLGISTRPSSMYDGVDQNQYPESRTLAVQWSGTDYIVAFCGFADYGAVVNSVHVLTDGRVRQIEPVRLLEAGQSLAQFAFDCDGPRCVLGARRQTPFVPIPEATYDGSISAVPVPNPFKRPELVLNQTLAARAVVAAQRGDTRVAFFSYDSVLFGSRIGANGLPIDAAPVPVIARPLADSGPRAMAMVGNGLYWRDDTAAAPRLMRTTIDLSAPNLVAGETTEIDSLTPVVLTQTSTKLYVVYRSMDLLMLRTYESPDPHPGTPRRRAAH